jgi:hypothetical protein
MRLLTGLVVPATTCLTRCVRGADGSGSRGACGRLRSAGEANLRDNGGLTGENADGTN